MKNRVISALLAAVLALGLTACRSGGTELAFQSAQAYTPAEVALPVETGLLYGSCTDGARLYFLAAAEAGQMPVLYRTDPAAGTVESLEGYRLPEEGAFTYSRFWGPFLGGDGTLWVWEEYILSYYDLPEDFDEDNDLRGSYYTGEDTFYHLRQLDPVTGRQLKLVDAGAVMEDLKRVESLLGMAVDKDGIIYIGSNKRITALDSAGEVLFTLKAEIDGTADNTLALLPDGTAIALLDTQSQGREVRSIDPAAKAWGEVRYAVPGSMWALYSGSGPYQFFCQRNNTLYGRLEGEALDAPLIRWDNAGLGDDGGVACFALLDGERAAVLTQTVPEGGTVQNARLRLRVLSPSNDLPSNGKIKLVYGTIGDDGWARRRVNEFNETNDKYYIELRDYAEGMLEYHGTDYRQVRDAAVTRLSAEIIAGRIPDILDDREIPLTALAQQGVLTDLWPYIDSDPELGREAVMDHVLDCAGTDGKLYRVFSNFRIDTLVARAETVGSRTGWTLEEMLAAYGGTMPEVYDSLPSSLVNQSLLGVSADQLLYRLLWMDLDRYVEWSTGECFFDTEDFRNVLRLCAGMNRESTGDLVPAALWEGQPVVYQRVLGSMGDLALDDAIFGGPKALMDYEAMMAENGVTAYKTKVDGEWVGIVDDRLLDAEMARESGLLSGGTPVAADFVTGAVEKSGYAAYVGFPTESGSGSAFRVSDCLAITEACKNKEGAWQFVRQLLLPGGSLANASAANLRVSYDAFPVNKADFAQLLEPRYLTDDAGEYVLDRNGARLEQAVSALGLGDPVALLVFLRSPTREQVERFYTLYRSIDHIADEDYALMTLIREQTQPYFAGDKSLEETVRLIQNRASLYVNENR